MDDQNDQGIENLDISRLDFFEGYTPPEVAAAAMAFNARKENPAATGKDAVSPAAIPPVDASPQAGPSETQAPANAQSEDNSQASAGSGATEINDSDAPSRRVFEDYHDPNKEENNKLEAKIEETKPVEDRLKTAIAEDARTLQSELRNHGLRLQDIGSFGADSSLLALIMQTNPEGIDDTNTDISQNLQSERQAILDPNNMNTETVRRTISMEVSKLATKGLAVMYVEYYKTSDPAEKLEVAIQRDLEIVKNLKGEDAKEEDLREKTVNVGGRIMNIMQAEEVLSTLELYVTETAQGYENAVHAAGGQPGTTAGVIEQPVISTTGQEVIPAPQSSQEQLAAQPLTAEPAKPTEPPKPATPLTPEPIR